MDITDEGRELCIDGGDFYLVFDKLEGMLSKWLHKGTAVLVRGLEPNFHRAATDNDRTRMKAVWDGMGLDRMYSRIEEFTYGKDGSHIDVNIVKIVACTGQKPFYRVSEKYRVHGSGVVDVDMLFQPMCKTDEYLPRIGTKFKIPVSMHFMKWYGRGPHESYEDRKKSALIGVYGGDVSDQLEPYEYPQESGNKSDTRWLSLKDIHGNGLFVAMDEPISASVLYYSSTELDRTAHLKDLVPDGAICVNIDAAQSGVGNHSCGPEPLEKYRLHAVEKTLRCRFEPFCDNEYDEEFLYWKNIKKMR
jgi:beta-galactosidase